MSSRGRTPRAPRPAALMALALFVLSCSESATVSAPGIPARMDKVSGDAQEAVVGHALPDPLVVKVIDADGDPVPNQVVNFVVVSGGGSVFAGAANTTAQGLAQERWTLGTSTSTEQKVEVRAVDGTTGQPIVFATFTATPLPDAPASLAIVGSDAPTGAVGEALADSLSVKVADQYGNGVPGQSVSWSVEAGGGAIAPATKATGVSGVARAQWTLGARLDTIQKAKAAFGAMAPVFFVAAPTLPATATIFKLNDAQEGAVAQALAQPLVVVVKLADGRPVRGAVVTWAASAGGGSLSATTSVTDAEGRASTTLTLGNGSGTHTVTASVAGLPPVGFSATALASAVAQIAKVAGDGQTADAGVAVSTLVRVKATDQYGNPAAGVSLSWAPSDGGAVETATATDADGIATARWVLGARVGAPQQLRVESGSGAAIFSAIATLSVSATIEKASGDAQAAVVGSALAAPVARVRLADGRPVNGAAVTWSTATSTISPLTTATNAEGNATTSWSLGFVAGPQSVTARLDGDRSVTFAATATPAAASQLVKRRGDLQSGTAGTPLGGPLVVAVTDQYGNGIVGVTVAWATSNGGITPSSATDVAGEAQAQWTPGVAGPNAATATAIGKTVTFTANAAAPGGSALSVVSGDAQSAVVTSPLPAALVVQLTNGGQPIAGAPVTWTVTPGGTLTPDAAVTDVQGLASARLTLGTKSGPVTVRAASSGAAPVEFNHAAKPGPVCSAGVLYSRGSSAPAMSQVPIQLFSSDWYGNPVPFNFGASQIRGGGSFTTLRTDETGTANGYWILGPTVGLQSALIEGRLCQGSSFPGSTRLGLQNLEVHATPIYMAIVISGDSQTAAAGELLPEPLVVRLTDFTGAPVAGLSVRYRLVYDTTYGTTATTDADGRASAQFRLPTYLGEFSGGVFIVEAVPDGASSVSFQATGVAGAPSRLNAAPPYPQSGTVGQPLSNPLRVVVFDQYNNRVKDATVTWSVTAGGGSVAPTQSQSDVGGFATTSLTLGPSPGTNTVRASLPNGASLDFTVSGVSP